MERYLSATYRRQYIALALSILVVMAMPAMVLAVSSTTPLTRISTTASGAEAIGGASLKTAVSADGRYVAFRSDATNLIPGDTNGVSDIFVKDTKTGAIVCASTDSGQTLGNGSSIGPSISADGQFVVFQSMATNLVPGDTNGVNDVFIKNLTTHVTTRVSTDSSNAQAIGASGGAPVTSADGRYVAIVSTATNLVPGDTNGANDAFVKDMQTGAMTRVSTDSSGTQANGSVSSTTIAISADGRYVAFNSTGTNLVPDDTNGFNDVFLKDMTTNVTTRVSTDSAGVQGNEAVTIAGGGGLTISGDGRYVAFISAATNMITDDTNGVLDVFIKDLTTGITTLASSDSNGVQGDGATTAQPPAFSYDGRYIIFASEATNLVPGDTNAFADTFMKDTLTGAVARISTYSTGSQINAATTGYSLSGDGQYVVFTSAVGDLVPNDTNGVTDVFYRVGPFWVEPPSEVVIPGAPNTGLPPARSNYLLEGITFVIIMGLSLQGIRFVRRRWV